MKKRWLLFAAHNGRRRARVHDGEVATLSSNVRWCSGALKFMCWNGEVVRVAFALNRHDREVIGSAAATAGLADWIEDYDTLHRYSRLAYRTPREYFRVLSQSAACPV